jgi:hypothetical protein
VWALRITPREAKARGGVGEEQLRLKIKIPLVTINRHMSSRSCTQGQGCEERGRVEG